MVVEKSLGHTQSVWITCDRPRCEATTEVWDPDRDKAHQALLCAGWSLYNHKNLCQRHTAWVARRLRKDWNV